MFVTALVLIGAYAIDHRRILPCAHRMKVTLDRLDRSALADPERMRAELCQRLGVEVLSFRIIALDYVPAMVRADGHYRRA
jgi:hypothetical protein